MPSEKLEKKNDKKRKALVEPLQPLSTSEQASLDTVFHKLLGKSKVAEIERIINNPSSTTQQETVNSTQSPKQETLTPVITTSTSNTAEVIELPTVAKMTTVANLSEPPQPMATVAKMTTVDETATVAKVTAQAKTTTVVTLAEVKGELRIPNTVVDNLFSLLDTTASMVYLRLYRLSHGYHKDICTVGLEKLAKSINSGERTVQRAIERLELLGLIERQGASFGGPLKGNIFKVNLPATVANLTTVADSTPIKSDDHDDLKKQDHHQSEHKKEVMMIYQKITGNNWSERDDTSYKRIEKVAIELVETTIRIANQRASSHPNSLSYFVKAILNAASPAPSNRAHQKKKMEQIVDRVLTSYVGVTYAPSDVVYKVKELCVKEDVPFDNDLFDDIMARRKN